jgi:hypothetical protein
VVAHRWLLLISYGIYAAAGLIFLILGVRKHGFSQPFRLAVGAALALLSLFWFITTLRSRSSMTNRNLVVRNVILIVLLMAHDTASGLW